MRVLVVDDSIIFRRAITGALTMIPGVQVVGQAPNGRLALQKVHDLRPDLITLDMEMPEMDGLAVLDSLRASGDMPAVIVVSALTTQGGRLTLQALQKGAFDFITKPDTIGTEQSLDFLRSELAPRIKALDFRLSVRNILHGKVSRSVQSSCPETAGKPDISTGDVCRRMNRLATAFTPELVLIGVSTGGPNVLSFLLSRLPAGLGVPVLVVQHMPPLFTRTLAEMLNAKCPLHVREAVHGEAAVADTVYIAPGGFQMKLLPGTDSQKIIEITSDPPENNCRPSVNYLFRSVAHGFPGRSVGIILTGMGNDGAEGLCMLKQGGAFIIAQDEASSVVYGMPKAAVETGVVDMVLPVEAIPDRVVSIVKGRGGA